MDRFNELKKQFKSHKAAAERLGIDRRTYFNYRKGNIPSRMAELIDLLLQNGNGTTPPASEREA